MDASDRQRLLGHAFWLLPAEKQPHEAIEFLNNLSMTGGVLLVLIAGSRVTNLHSHVLLKKGRP